MPKPKPKEARPPRFFVDNSMLSEYKNCPRKYYLRYVRDWTTDAISKALCFGAAWHEAMAVVWAGYAKLNDEKLAALAMQAFMDKWVEEGGPADMDLQTIEQWEPRTPATAAAMLANYIIQRRPMLEKMKVISVEQPFAVPIFADRDDVWYIGRKDARAILNGRKIIEHKTTSEYKIDGGFKSSFVDSFSPNSQCQGYLYDDMVSEAKPADQLWVDAALVHKKVHDAFKFIPVSQATEGMDAWLWETRDWVQRVLSEHERLADQDPRATHMTAFPKNTEHCQGKYGTCQFLDICRSVPNPHKLKGPPQGYKEKHWEPFDVLGLDKIMEK